MEGVSLIIPVFNKSDITRRCIDQIKKLNRRSDFEIIVVDNGSTDETPSMLSKDHSIVYIRNAENLGISKACNLAGGRARYDVLCFMHNDVFVYEEEWTSKIRQFILRHSGTGVVGLYGAKTLRKNGSFRGKTIVHSKKDRPAIAKAFERVATIDGLFMAMRKSVFEDIGGYNELFPIHYYDKDISLRAVKHDFDNYIINMPFEHECGSTRKQIRDENQVREEARGIFIGIWEGFLPVDVNSLREKLGYLLGFKGSVKR